MNEIASTTATYGSEIRQTAVTQRRRRTQCATHPVVKHANCLPPYLPFASLRITGNGGPTGNRPAAPVRDI